MRNPGNGVRPKARTDQARPSIQRVLGLSPGSSAVTSPAFVFLLLILVATSCARVHPTLEVAVRQPLGDSFIETVLYSVPGSDLILFNMHEDEKTSVEAGLTLIRRKGGRILTLRHSGNRMVEFGSGDRIYQFDPNRIYTDSGAVRTIEPAVSHSDRPFEIVRDFARHLIEDYRLDRSSVIVTLHNNGEGGYSALSYQDGGSYAADAARVHLEPGQDPDDFFFVTDADLFDTLSSAGFNVVLQDNRNVTDDGSLSVLAARRSVPYVNVEAQHGHLKQQQKMLKKLFEILLH